MPMPLLFIDKLKNGDIALVVVMMMVGIIMIMMMIIMKNIMIVGRQYFQRRQVYRHKAACRPRQ